MRSLVLLLLLVGVTGVGCRSANQSTTELYTSHGSTSGPLSGQNSSGAANTSSPQKQQPQQLAQWIQNWVDLASRLNQSAPSGRDGQAWSSLLSKLPGIFRGLGAGTATATDPASLLAKLFSDPSMAGIPAWIQNLMGVGNSSKTAQEMADVYSRLQTMDPDHKLQTLLGHVFTDVTQGMQSLNLDSNSTVEDVVAAISNDSQLMRSLSSDASQLVGLLAEELGLPSLLQQAFSIDNDTQCGADLVAFAEGLQQGQLWALQMLDASGKLQAGVLTGQVTLVGDFDQCVDVTSARQNWTIEGLFCSGAFDTPQVMIDAGSGMSSSFGSPLTLQLCVPRACDEGHVEDLLSPIAAALKTKVKSVSCFRPMDPEGDERFLDVVVVLGILAFLCAAGTAYGVYLDCDNSKREAYAANDKAEPEKNGHVNEGFTNGEPQRGGHVNGDLTNGILGIGVNGSGPIMAYHDTSFTNNVDPVNMTVASKQTEAKGLNDLNGIKNGNGHTAQSVHATSASTEKGLASKLLLSFSVLRNGRKLLDCTKNQSDVTCIHGIRVLSITWVVFGHCFGQQAGNSTALAEMASYFPFMVYIGALLSVDTFFFLSGTLTAYLFLKSTKKSGVTFSGMVLYYVHRIWRLTPMYGLLLAFYIGIFPYLMSGPNQYTSIIDSTTNCRDYWWYNILYINNVVDQSLEKMLNSVDGVKRHLALVHFSLDRLRGGALVMYSITMVVKWCFAWSWYLSNDMQFYVISPIVLIPWAMKGMYRQIGVVIGFIAVIGLILVHIISSAVISYRDNLAIFYFDSDYMAKVYFVPWCRVGPYAVGLILGYIMFKTRCKYRMTQMSVVMGWAMAWAVGLTMVYIHYDNVGDIMTKGLQWNQTQMSAYEALAKVVWAVCVGWVIFACCTGHGGFVNTLLSWSAWIPLSRLSYGVYLIHLIFLYTFVGNQKKPLFMDFWTGTEIFLTITVISFLGSFVFSMLIEAPCLGLEKAVLGKIFHKKK